MMALIFFSITKEKDIVHLKNITKSIVGNSFYTIKAGKFEEVRLLGKGEKSWLETLNIDEDGVLIQIPEEKKSLVDAEYLSTDSQSSVTDDEYRKKSYKANETTYNHVLSASECSSDDMIDQELDCNSNKNNDSDPEISTNQSLSTIEKFNKFKTIVQRKSCKRVLSDSNNSSDEDSESLLPSNQPRSRQKKPAVIDCFLENLIKALGTKYQPDKSFSEPSNSYVMNMICFLEKL